MSLTVERSTSVLNADRTSMEQHSLNRRLKRKLTDTAQIKSQRRQPIVRNKSLECVVDTNHARDKWARTDPLPGDDALKRHLVVLQTAVGAVLRLRRLGRNPLAHGVPTVRTNRRAASERHRYEHDPAYRANRPPRNAAKSGFQTLQTAYSSDHVPADNWSTARARTAGRNRRSCIWMLVGCRIDRRASSSNSSKSGAMRFMLRIMPSTGRSTMRREASASA